MNERKDNIYIYLWEEFNTIYIGRTINPKSRHYQHRHNTTESTYQFSSKHQVEHPKMIIIENDLTVEEGIKREKYWIREYKENSPYNVLNKSKGGQSGLILNLTEEERENRMKGYMAMYMKEYRKENKTKTKDINRKYRQSHKEELKEMNKEYRETHKEELREKKKKYRENHKEEIKERKKKYYEENKSKILERQREYSRQYRLRKKSNNTVIKDENDIM